MRYQVRFVDDASLPSEVEFAFVRQAGEAVLFVKQSAIDVETGQCNALTRAWTVWQRVQEEPRPRVQVSRIPSGTLSTGCLRILSGVRASG